MSACLSNPRAITAAAVKDAVSILDIAQRYGIDLRRQGREYFGLSPFKHERTPSFSIDPAKGLFKCFASGEGGDVIRFVQLMDGCGFADALKKLAGEAGLGDPEEDRRRAERFLAQQRSREQNDAERIVARIGAAWSVWRYAQPAPGTLVETYLRARGIDCDALARVYGWTVPTALRFHPSLPTWDQDGGPEVAPAMIGCCWADIRGRGTFRGIHRTWLAPDGLGKAAVGKAKKILGQMMCAETRLSAPGPVAVIGEGYETVLSVMAELARDGEMVFGLSALSLGNMAGAGIRRPGDPPRHISVTPDPTRPGITLPSEVREVVLLKDADGKNPADIDRFLRRAATKFQASGIKVRIATPELGKDFNDMAIKTEVAA